MAQRVEVLLIDDVDGSEAHETVGFSLDGAYYEVDLSHDNASKLREVIQPWAACARKTGRSGRRRPVSRVNLGASPQVVRVWAQANGYKLSNRGRVPESIQEAYRAAHPNE